MSVCAIQPNPFTLPDVLHQWANENDLNLLTVHPQSKSYPSLSSLDLIYIMGGPMGVKEQEAYPWITKEKDFISSAIEQSVPLYGSCLGAQLIAHVLGGAVEKASHREVGWFPISWLDHAKNNPIFDGLDLPEVVFHYHNDTFECPDQAKRLASSHGCLNQVIANDQNCLAVQFHLEFGIHEIQRLLENEYSARDLSSGQYVQSQSEILAKEQLAQKNTEFLKGVLTNLIHL